jgi:hypothetical protein
MDKECKKSKWQRTLDEVYERIDKLSIDVDSKRRLRRKKRNAE